MPYFLCPNCAARAYSAAVESRCPSCAAPLRRKHQVNSSTPLAEPLTPGGASARWRTRQAGMPGLLDPAPRPGDR